MKYENNCYQGEKLRAIGRAYSQHIPDDCDLIASTGSSGCAIASAILMTYRKRNLTHIYVRKPRESRHGGDMSFKWSDIQFRYEGNLNAVIVDDFIDSGKTIERVYSKLLSLEITVKKVIIGYSYGEAFQHFQGRLPDNVEMVMLEEKEYDVELDDASYENGKHVYKHW